MKQEITNKSAVELDGFDTFTDAVEGDDGATQVSSSIIQGARIKFGNASAPTTWMLADGTQLPPELELVAIDILRVEQKWPPDGNDDSPDTKVLAGGEKFRNVDKLNAETPQSEWRTGPNGLTGPYQNAYVLYLLDPLTMERFTLVTGTTGGQRAVRDLRDQVVWMRKFRGAHFYPVVVLSDCFMPTRFGGRQRPSFTIKHWVTFGDGGEATALPAPATPSETLPDKPPPLPKTTVSKSDGGMRTVDPPSAKEVTKDEIIW